MPFYLANEVTFSFKEDINAFTSFKSYIPDWGLSLNNRYYTIKDGSIWEHNIETDESIVDLPITGVIDISFVETDIGTGNLIFTIDGNIQGLGLRSDDVVIIDFYDETDGIVYQDRRAFIPDLDDAQFRIYSNIEGNYEDIVGKTSNTYKVTRLQLVRLNRIPRNTFYNDDKSESVVEFIMNQEPSVVKQFKTIGYEGIGLWDFQIYTDVESEVEDEDEIPKRYLASTLAGVVSKDNIVVREGKFFANIQGTEKNVTNLDFSSISVQGIGKGNPTGLVSDSKVLLEVDPDPDIRINYELFYFSNLASPGDVDYYGVNPTIKYAGRITDVDGRTITYSKGLKGTDPSVGDFFLYARNEIIEKSGVVGAYAHVRMTNDDDGHAEVFTVNSQVVPSSN